MGCVYLAEHQTLRCKVAVKTILPFQDDDRGRRMFYREAQVCAQIDHPNVVVILHAGEEEGIPYIIMRYVAGKNLAEYLQDHGGPIPWRTGLNVMRLAARGLAAVHKKQLVHRDIKPSNIMVSFEGRVLVMDFGLVRDASEASLSGFTGVTGTPQYMSPEQCRGAHLDARSDIFSVGSTLYHLLSGTPPFGDGNSNVVMGRILGRLAPRPVHEVNPSVPPAVSRLVARCMAFDPHLRIASAEALQRAIRETIEDRGADEDPCPAVPAQSPDAIPATLAPLELISVDSMITPHWSPPGGKLILVVLPLLLALLGLVFVTSHTAERPAAAPPADLAEMVEIPEGKTVLGTSRERLQGFFDLLQEKFNISVTWKSNDFDISETSIHVKRFFIDRYEVTNAEYLRFVDARHHPAPGNWPGGRPTQEMLHRPVTGVSVADAEKYAEYVHKSLPSVAQWMRAAHGDTDTFFPWGNEYETGRANVEENPAFSSVSAVEETPGDVSPGSIYNLAGNVSELTRETEVMDGGVVYIVKGACARGGRASNLGLHGLCYFKSRLAYGQPSEYVGFRCVYEPPDGAP
jgi:serine/threonine protein kinase